MKQKRLTWFERITAFFARRDPHHRVCQLCRKPIKKGEHWHQVRVGWFAPYYTVQHKNCASPRQDAVQQIDRPIYPELPFDLLVTDIEAPAGDIYLTYGSIQGEKNHD